MMESFSPTGLIPAGPTGWCQEPCSYYFLTTVDSWLLYSQIQGRVSLRFVEKRHGLVFKMENAPEAGRAPVSYDYLFVF